MKCDNVFCNSKLLTGIVIIIPASNLQNIKKFCSERCREQFLLSRSKDECLTKAKSVTERSEVRYWELRAEGKSPSEIFKIMKDEGLEP